MIDPVTAFAAANAAFKGVKMLVGAGREMQDVSQQLGKWYSAVADISRAETQRKQPTWLDKVSQGSENIEQQAMDIVVRKKTLIEKEKEIKFMLDFRFGPGTYDEMLTCAVKYVKNVKKQCTVRWNQNVRFRIIWL